MKRDIIYLNGDFSTEDLARISPFDRGFLYGDSVFESLRSFGRRPAFLAEHLERISKSLAIMGIDILLDQGEILSIIEKLHELNDLSDAYIRITVSRGEDQGGPFNLTTKNPTVLIVARELKPYPDRLYKEGMRVGLLRRGRSSNSISHKMKSTNLIESILARKEDGAGLDELVFLDSGDRLLEGTVSNIFIVRGESLITPPISRPILPGITRSVIILLAEKIGIEVKEKDIELSEIIGSDEAFLTNSLMGVMAISEVFKGGERLKLFLRSHKVTDRLSTQYLDLARG